MKHPRLYPSFVAAALLGAANPGPAAAQTSAVVGFLRNTVKAAADPGTPTATALSFPLHETADFTGAVAAVNGADVLTVASAAWTAGQWTDTPHLLHVNSGASTGRWFLITGNTDAVLTVNARGLDLSTLLGTGDALEILPAHTLGSVFGTDSVALQSGASGAVADTVQIWNGVKFKTYFHNGSFWTKNSSGANVNNVVIPPDAGVFVNRRATSPVTLLLNGVAPDTTERSDVPGPASTFLANRFPVDTSIGALGLQALPNWQNGTGADNVMLWKKGVWQTFGFNGTNWVRLDTGAVADTKPVPAGSAVMVVRQSAASGPDATLAQEPPYPVN